MSEQAPHAVLIIRPAAFGANPETAGSNAFQKEETGSAIDTSKKAMDEFDEFVLQLEHHNIEVVVVEDTPEPVKPDAVFPNNWISLQPDGTVVLYPMLSPKRRNERRNDIPVLLEHLGYSIENTIDLTHHESENRFLEGTGSIIFDHPNKKAYANESPRTDIRLFEELCKQLGYTPVSFQATDPSGMDIYHTNVLMHIGTGYAVICLDAIPDILERAMVVQQLKSTDKTIIEITWQQLSSFAGNMLEVLNREGERFIVMSESAYNSLQDDQLDVLESKGTIIAAPLNIIETYGGGSARCMLAGIHLPRD